MALWFVTQLHLLRVARRIESNIDAKREATEAFVDTRLRELEKNVGGFEARVTAQLPPNVHGELEELKAEFTRQFQAIDRGISAALGSIDHNFKAVVSGLSQQEVEMRKELALASGELDVTLQEAMAQADTSNPLVRRLYAWAAKPVDPKLEAKNPIGATVLQFGKAAMLDKLQEADLQGGTRSFLKRRSNGSWNPGLKS